MLIGEVSRLYNVPVDTLRYYDRIGLLSPERQGSQRRYSRENCRRLEAVLKMKKLMFSLEEIQAILAMDDLVEQSIEKSKLDQHTAGRILDKIRAKYKEIEELETSIQDVKHGLAHIIEKITQLTGGSEYED